MKNKKYISFFGSIGVGKTTTGMNIESILETSIFISENIEENIYLDNFYYDMKQWGFLSTLEMLILMSNQLDRIPPDKNIVILDNGIAELICYATLEYQMGILSKEQFYTYQRLYQKFLQLTPTMNLYVFFYCDLLVQKERIRKRGRSCEATIDDCFLIALNREYLNWVQTLPSNKLLFIDTTNGINLYKLKNDILYHITAVR